MFFSGDRNSRQQVDEGDANWGYNYSQSSVTGSNILFEIAKQYLSNSYILFVCQITYVFSDISILKSRDAHSFV